MKVIILLVLLAACGKHNESDKPMGNVFVEEYSIIGDQVCRDTYDAQTILRQAAQTGTLHDYHNVKWFNHAGQYMFKSVVLSDNSWRLD